MNFEYYVLCMTNDELRKKIADLLASETASVKSTGWIKLDKRTWTIIPR